MIEKIKSNIIADKFFSNHPNYKVYQESVTQIMDTLEVDAKCQIITPSILTLRKWIPKRYHANFFDVQIHMAVNFDNLHVVVNTRSLHSDFYHSTIHIDLNLDLSIRQMKAEVHINQSFRLFAKPVEKKLESIVCNTIQEDYDLILKKLKDEY